MAENSKHSVTGQKDLSLLEEDLSLLEEREISKKAGKKRPVLVACFSLLFLTLLGWGGFLWYASDYYRAEDIALEVVAEGNITVVDHLMILPAESDLGIIFYPGAKVEAIAYLPLLQKLQQEGFTCVLVEMPYHMAIFDVDAAEDVFALDLPVNSWYIAGHSMGGGMASAYASDNPEKIEGLLLLGAYVYGDYPPEKALTIYGTYNDNLLDKIDYTENILEIVGGNHAKYGNYGIQKGDPEGDITTEEQQNLTVQGILDFVGLDRLAPT